ncbi:MAG: peptide chain release factor N(5)-glutamine methyltransferase [Pseudomonadota bacterium]
MSDPQIVVRSSDDPRETVGSLYRHVRDRFRRSHLETPDLDARQLVCHVTGLTTAGLISEPDRPLDPSDKRRTDRLVARRLAGESVARLMGERDFWGRSFEITAETLEPRPDTETLIEVLLSRRGADLVPDATVLDIGTGSGIIATTLLAECPRMTALASDVSPGALAVARRNAARHGVAARCRFVCMSYFEALSGRFDLIVSNPPYIPSEDIETLDADVRCHDPRIALDGGKDGYAAYRRIFSGAGRHLIRGGLLLVEIGFDQADGVSRLAQNNGFTVLSTATDLEGRDRAVLAMLP